jgi:protein gp37
MTSIEWTDESWNPVTGCTKVSPGCKNCYAERMTERFGRQKFTDIILHPDRLDKPLRWRKPRRVFVNSMSDLFHEDVPDDYIAAVFGVMARASHHTFQILTKREDRMREWFTQEPHRGWLSYVICASGCENPQVFKKPLGAKEMGEIVKRGWPLPNAWLGVSVETTDYLWRADHLREVPAAVRFLSLEPLLGPLSSIELSGIHWVIAGGESGPGARPCNVEWIRSIVRQCRDAQVPCFVKQLGTWPYRGSGDERIAMSDKGAYHYERATGQIFQEQQSDWITHFKGGDPSEWPEDLRVREYPG